MRFQYSRQPSRRGCVGGLRNRSRSGGCETYPAPSILYRLLSSSLLNLIIPLLANRHRRGKLLRHIAVGKGVLHFFRQSHPQYISKGRGIAIQIGGNNLELSIILRDHTVLLLSFPHLLFGGGYSVRVPKSCFQELYYSW